jgi:hypothetical protein
METVFKDFVNVSICLMDQIVQSNNADLTVIIMEYAKMVHAIVKKDMVENFVKKEYVKMTV